MILYDPSIPVSLSEFGILIPIRDSRATRTFDALSRHPDIGPDQERWYVSSIDEVLTREDLARVHTARYLNRLYSPRTVADEIVATYELVDARGNYYRYAPQQALRPLSELFERIVHRAAGTVLCGRIALSQGFCFYFSGGMHHAHADFGSGFCLINDIAIAARKLQAEQRVGTVWIVDVDAHKGDGTASITAGDESIQTLSIHMAQGWPLDGPYEMDDGRPNPSFIPSNIDIPIDAGMESDYLSKLETGLHALAQGSRPDLAIVVCGADPFEEDELPSTRSLRLSLEQMLSRDQMVYRFLTDRHIPAAFLMAGGYGERVWQVYTQFLVWALSERHDRFRR